MANVNHLSKVQRAGQRLMVGFDGPQLDDRLKYYIDELKVGGIILFSRNMVSPDQIETLCHEAQTYAQTCGQPPLLVGIDQEGGVVARLKPPFTQFKGNPHIISVQDAVHFAQTTANELNQIGVNMNMAPVLDILPQKGASVMQNRAFGHDPDQVALMGTTVITHLQKNRVMAVAKHFPGIGRTVLDSHLDLPDLETDAETLTAIDIKPFKAAIKNQVSGIMLSHIRYLGLDPDWPASLSPTIARQILRHQMAFDGLVLTDDLDMGAIAKHYPLPVIVEQCLTATVDILLICHPSPKIEEAHHHIMMLHQHSEALLPLEDQALFRIMDAKADYLR